MVTCLVVHLSLWPWAQYSVGYFYALDNMTGSGLREDSSVYIYNVHSANASQEGCGLFTKLFTTKQVREREWARWILRCRDPGCKNPAYTTRTDLMVVSCARPPVFKRGLWSHWNWRASVLLFSNPCLHF